jgi:Ca2+-binding EF-hand superfamily protein
MSQKALAMSQNLDECKPLQHGTPCDSLDDDRLRNIFAKIVGDADGQLSFDEFSKLMTMSEAVAHTRHFFTRF